jgi:tripartite ATP-independent transporter DctP family solute receptor
MKYKPIVWGLAAGVLSTSLFATPSLPAEITLTCGHDQPKAGTFEIIWQAFKLLVEPLSAGRIEVKVIGGAQLGDEDQLLENMKIGSVDCAASSFSSMTTVIPQVGLMAVPYIIENKAHRARLVEPGGKFFNAMSEIIEETGHYRFLGIYTTGVRSVYNSKRPIKTPEDLKGLKIRVTTSPISVESWKALGAVPTALPFSEVYTALLTGVVDAAENSPMFLWSMKHYEGVKYFSLTSHLLNTGAVLFSEKAYQKLPRDLRVIVLNAAAQATASGRFYDEEANETLMRKVVEAGIIINEVDTAPFVDKVRPLHEKVAKDLSVEPLLKILREEAKAAR